MRVLSLTLADVKSGLRPDEYEDAAYPTGRSSRRGRSLRFAVADGATETSFAGRWAELLTLGFGRSRAPLAARWLEGAQATWQAETAARPLPWYAEMKAQSGAYAALVGLELLANGQWRALAAGDCCLFQVRDGTLRRAFPLRAAAEFSNRPALLSSRLPASRQRTDLLFCDEGDWTHGDQFWLMSDALAHWFLQEAENQAVPWATLQQVMEGGLPLFRRWLASLRRARCLRNDDVTLMRVQPENADVLADAG